MHVRMHARAHACVRVRMRACVGLPQEEILSCERRDPRDALNNAEWNLGTVERGGFQLYSSMQSEAEPHAARRRSGGCSPDADVELAWAHPAHVCTATAPTAATSALGAGPLKVLKGQFRGTQMVLKGYPRGAQAGQCFLSGNDVCDAKASKEAVKKMLDHGGISYIATTVGSVGVAHVATACYAMQRSCARCNSMLQPRCTRCNGAVRDATRRIPRETVP